MVAVLVILAIVCLLAAGAIWLWFDATAKQRQKAAAEHAEVALNAVQAAQPQPAAQPQTGSAPNPAGLSPAMAALMASSNASMASASTGANARPGAANPAASSKSHQQPSLQSLPAWRAVLRRAALADTAGTWIKFALLGLVVAGAVALRIQSMTFGLVAFIVYAAAVGIWLSRRISKQKILILNQLPDFLENMVRLAGTGNSLSMAFQMASTQVDQPLRQLLDSTVSQARTGMDLDRALLQASKPYDLPELETLAVILGTSLRIGGRSDQILQRMSDFLRDLDQARRELAANTSEIRASAWVLAGLAPICAVAMALLNPEFMVPLLHEPLGHKLLFIALALESLGGFVLYRLAKSL